MLCHRDRVHVGKIPFLAKLLALRRNTAAVEIRIVRDKHRIPTECMEPRQYRLNRISVCDHIVGNACQFDDPVRNRHPRIDEFTEALCNLAIFVFDSADLDDLTLTGI